MNPMSEQEFQDHLRQANWAMRGQIDENRKAFQLESYHRFDWDQWRGELVFSSGGTPKVVARIQIVGNHSTKSNVWVWAWANSSYLSSVKQAALKAQQFGSERGIIRLIQPRWAAKESDAWEMTAMTGKLVEAKGAYKCPSPDGFTYMAFTDIRAVSDRKRLFGAQACAHVAEEDKPILLLSREMNGEVLALCGGENDTADALHDVPLAQLLDLDPTLALLADMPDGWAAMRESPDHDWVRSKAE
ncbi:MAG TPA: hypothetical protein VE981_17805 [Planctomycetota bacterium]|nr:hypothetical protein [Planctomycetota bacterium]